MKGILSGRLKLLQHQPFSERGIFRGLEVQAKSIKWILRIPSKSARLPFILYNLYIILLLIVMWHQTYAHPSHCKDGHLGRCSNFRMDLTRLTPSRTPFVRLTSLTENDWVGELEQNFLHMEIMEKVQKPKRNQIACTEAIAGVPGSKNCKESKYTFWGCRFSAQRPLAFWCVFCWFTVRRFSAQVVDLWSSWTPVDFMTLRCLDWWRRRRGQVWE